MIIALNPNITTRSFIKGNATTLSPLSFAGCRDSSHLKKTNNKKAMLQINANRDKNKITLIFPDLICCISNNNFYKLTFQYELQNA